MSIGELQHTPGSLIKEVGTAITRQNSGREHPEDITSGIAIQDLFVAEKLLELVSGRKQRYPIQGEDSK